MSRSEATTKPRSSSSVPASPGQASASDPLAVQRGVYSSDLSGGKLLLAAFRAIAGPLQWLIITSHPLSYFGVPDPPTGTGDAASVSFLKNLGLDHSRLPTLSVLMALMPTILGLKHIIWVIFLGREKMTVQFGLFGGLADTIYEAITSLVFTAAAVNPMFSPLLVYVGFVTYVSAVAVELLCEIQRDRFKKDPRNKGRICDRGLWGVVRHPNYTANIIFGFSYGLAAGGFGYALATG